jgi:outer membrane lipoprotein-sorting protein
MNRYLRPANSKVLATLSVAVLSVAVARAQSADDILKKMRDTYAAMNSYADSGTVINEYGPSGRDRHSFTTYFNRSPRHFLLDFRKQGGDQYVVWADPDAFHTWWKTTGQQTDYPNPNNVPAISQSGQNTKQAALKIPTLLYSKAQMGGDFNNFADEELDGTEEIGGRRCYRLLGRASDTYAASGKEVNTRKMTVWIDAESYLVRQILEEWKAVGGSRTRLTTTYQPQANPSLEDNKFKFTPPEPK